MNLERLIALAAHHVPAHRRGRQTARPMAGLAVLRDTAPSRLEASLYEPVLCLILQGRKAVAIGEDTLAFGAGEYLLVSHDLPVSSRIAQAPYLALVLAIDAATIRRLYEEVTEPVRDDRPARAAVTHRADPGLVDALGRYLALADAPADARVLGPLVHKELHYRLLAAPAGGMLRHLIRHDSHASAVARAIRHLRADLRAAVEIPALARQVGMSASSFHKHFKAITATTPLQYQKELRLLEARRRLQHGGAAVTATAFDVGYESASQFSREYARKFGRPPSGDLPAAPTAGRRPSATPTARR